VCEGENVMWCDLLWLIPVLISNFVTCLLPVTIQCTHVILEGIVQLHLDHHA